MGGRDGDRFFDSSGGEVFLDSDGKEIDLPSLADELDSGDEDMGPKVARLNRANF